MKPKIHFKSLLLGAVLGGVVAFFMALVVMQPSDDSCWLHVKNTGARTVQLQGLGGRLPLRITTKIGYLPVPRRKEYWGRLLQPGESGSMPYAPGGTITVMEMRGGIGVTHPVWTGIARTLVAQVNADDITNITFQITSQTP